jgi:nuclear GTP-binding protein
MYNMKPQRNTKGKFIKGDLMNARPDTPVVRVQPDRKWFGNTRIIGQQEMDRFREEMKAKVHDPYTVILKRKHLPMGLLSDTTKVGKANILGVESFDYTFGKKKQRKKPTLKVNSYDSLIQRANRATEEYADETDTNRADSLGDGFTNLYAKNSQPIFNKGQSARIKGELYKVIDSSDVLIQVLDARDPDGTRSLHVEKYLKTACSHKHLILVLNKVDLVPTWVTARWIKHLSAEYPTLAFHAKINKSFGKGSLIQLLRQFGSLHSDRKKISVGFFGYPNVGKSSVINTLRQKLVCNVAPIPGETKVWQYVTLTNQIYLVDCPGVVYPRANETDANRILKGVVRIENVEDAQDYVEELLNRIRPEYMEKTYGIGHWTSHMDFLARFAQKTGKLSKGGEPDFHVSACMVIHDWQRGKLPWFVCPPFEDDLEKEAEKQKKMEIEKEEKEKQDEKEIEYEPVQLLTEITQTHEFSTKDQSESAFMRTDVKMSDGPTKEELAKIVVDNPLGLAEDDPLLLETKRRKWQESKK